jgi:hypothetical protein
MYETLFVMVASNAYMPFGSSSLAVAACTRIFHYMPIYFVLFALLIVIFSKVATMVSASMDASENRFFMKFL